MFKLFDGYSTTIDKINKKTDEATDKVLKASGATDKFNGKLEATGASANKASSGLRKFVSLAALTAGTIKGMKIADEYTNTAARLDLINDGLQTQAELQDKIFAAADRAKGSYSDMAAAIAKMGLLASDAFSSNNELIAFTELVQKSFKVSGADTSEQQGAMRQLSQAMASGRLQGDELVSIMENAPMIYEAIAKYTGLTKGELKELSSDGAITPDIIKNAMFMAADDINAKFETMPRTFGNIWNEIKNGALQAFGPIIENVNNFINTSSFMSVVNTIIGGIYLLADIISYISNLVIDNWPLIQTILITLGVLIGVHIIGYLLVAIPLLISFISVWATANYPIIMLAATLGLFIYALNQAGITATDVFTTITGGVNVVIQFFKNLGLEVANVALGIGNAIGALASNIMAAFHNAIKSVQSWWYDMLSTALTVVEQIAAALNKLPFVSFDYSGITSAADDYAAKSAKAAGSKKEYTSISEAFTKGHSTFDVFQAGWTSDAYKSGQEWGTDKIEKLKNGFDKLMGKGGNKDNNKGFDMSQFGTPGKPLTIEGKGKNKKVEVDMSDEDLKYLRDIAERDYINKFSTATLAPNISVSFGDVHETADADKVAGRIKKILQEEIAMTAEGAYSG